VSTLKKSFKGLKETQNSSDLYSGLRMTELPFGLSKGQISLFEKVDRNKMIWPFLDYDENIAIFWKNFFKTYNIL